MHPAYHTITEHLLQCMRAYSVWVAAQREEAKSCCTQPTWAFCEESLRWPCGLSMKEFTEMEWRGEEGVGVRD